MAWKSRTNVIRSQGLFSITKLLEALGRRTAARRVAVRPLLDPLEPRQLLSASTLAHPLFVTYHASPDAVRSAVTEVSPAQMRQAYGINSIAINGVVGDGTGQTIAIVDAFKDPTLAADLATFDSTFGIAAPPKLVMIRQDGSLITSGNQPPVDNVDPAGNSWAVETSLDVEWAHVIAPKANILLVLANDSGNGLYTAVTEAAHYTGTTGMARASVVSMSWGGGDLGGTTDSTFNVAGTTFFAASGDSGAYTTSGGGASYPASSPNVVAVGGTTLQLSGGSYLSESAWNGSGGGLSTVEAEPTWQKTIVPSSITTTHRALPDVSMNADPNSGVAVIDSYDFGSTASVQIGGTSLATPMWAALVAIANQERASAGLAALNSSAANSTLPMLYGLPSSDFHDITTGSNGHAATVGFDLATGRGTPIANLLVAGLVGNQPAQPAPSVNSLNINPGSVTQGVGTAVTLTANATDSSAATITGVNFYTSGGTLLGGGVQNGSNWSYTIASTAALAAGNYSYYAVATDSAGLSTPTGSGAVSATLTVLTPGPVNDFFANATVLSGNTVTITGSNVNATKEAGEPSLAGNAGGKSVWYSWTATTSGKVNVNTTGSNFDTMLGVYNGSSVSALSLVASNDDASLSVLTSALSFNAVAGTTYHIAVDGYNGGGGAASGNITLNLAKVATPANDNFANAAALSGTSTTWTGSNVGATRESGEPYPANVYSGNSVWFSWTAVKGGTVSLNTHGSNFDTVLGVYTGSSVTGLTAVAANDDDPAGGTLTSSVTFNAVAGTTYHFVVAGYGYSNPAAGNITLNLSQTVSAVQFAAAAPAPVQSSAPNWGGYSFSTFWTMWLRDQG